MFIASFAAGPWQANCYILTTGTALDHGNKAVIIDPGVDAKGTVEQFCTENNLTIDAVVCTHGHVDHIADAAKLANEHKVGMWLHPDDYFMMLEPAKGLGFGSEQLIQQVLGSTTLPKADQLNEFSDGQVLQLAGMEFQVTHCPGHSPGCVVLASGSSKEPILFSGDVLFAQSIGRMDLPGSSPEKMKISLRKLESTLADEVSILPGHGPGATMAEVRKFNLVYKEALA